MQIYVMEELKKKFYCTNLSSYSQSLAFCEKTGKFYIFIVSFVCIHVCKWDNMTGLEVQIGNLVTSGISNEGSDCATAAKVQVKAKPTQWKYYSFYFIFQQQSAKYITDFLCLKVKQTCYWTAMRYHLCMYVQNPRYRLKWN